MRVTGALRGALAAGLALGVLAVAGPPAYAEDQECESIPEEQVPTVTADRAGSPVRLMQVAAAHEAAAVRGEPPGKGVTVAVLDSGIAGTDLINVTKADVPTDVTSELEEWQGTAVAGLIGARGDEGEPIGIAPGALIVDVPVYDRLVSDDPDAESEPSLAALIDGLRFVAEADKGVVEVVNVSFAVPRNPELDDEMTAVLDDLAAKDVVVVAATGDRPEDSDALYSLFGYDGEDPPHGEDARAELWPAKHPSVVGVNASASVLVEDEVVPGDAADSVLRSSATDVAAPTADAVSVAVDGRSTCLLPDVSTAWAAAEVSGIVALLRWRYPGESAQQIVGRLQSTATGSPRSANVLTGHGVVQPLEALRRPLQPDRAGKTGDTRVAQLDKERAEAPRPQADVLASTKRNAVWWGLLAGGALVVAVLLRPVLARRRD